MENKIYRLEEMLEAMNASRDNLCDVINQQSKLIEIVRVSEDAKQFEQFISESEVQLNELKSQFDMLSIRIKSLYDFIEFVKKSSEFSEATTLLFDALGMFTE